MARAGAVQTPAEAVDVVILTVILAELDAARRVLQIDDLDREKDTDGTVYFRGAVRSALTDRDYAIALGCIGSAGNPGAAAAAASAIATHRPHVVLLMGIEAGLRDKVRIGEVVLSDRVVTYEPAALVRTASGATEQPRPEVDRAPHTILQDVVSYRADPSRLRAAFDRAGGILPAAPVGREDEFRAHVAGTITARLGTIASGEKLLRDPAKLVAMRELHGKTEVGEMEAAGLVDACRRGSVPWLVIRGKTSLLRWVERNVLLDRPVIWFDPSRGVTPASMVQSIARALGKPQAAAALDRPDATGDQAGQLLDALVPFVLLVDDADALASRGQGFADGFFEAVRTLVQCGSLTWVSASRHSLYDASSRAG